MKARNGFEKIVYLQVFYVCQILREGVADICTEFHWGVLFCIRHSFTDTYIFIIRIFQINVRYKEQIIVCFLCIYEHIGTMFTIAHKQRLGRKCFGRHWRNSNNSLRICGADRTALFATAYIHATSQFSDSSSYTKSPCHSTKIHTYAGTGPA